MLGVGSIVRASILAVVVCLASGCIGAVRPVALSANEVPLRVEETTLDSGLRVVIESSRSRAIAGVVLLVHSGARWDPPGKEGLSHLVEHLVFRQRAESGADLRARLNAMGAVANGSTDFDLNWYHAFVPSEQLHDLVALIVGVIADPLRGVDRVDFRQEQAIVQAERGNRQDDTPGQLDTWLAKSMLKDGQASARAGGGSKQSIDSLSLDDARAFAQRFYRPERTTLYVRIPEAMAASSTALAGLSMLRQTGHNPTKAAPYFPPTPQPSRLREPGGMARTQLSVSSPEMWLSWPIRYQSLSERAEAEAIAQIADLAIMPNFQSAASIAGAGCRLRRFLDTPALVCNILLKHADSAEIAVGDAISGMRRSMQWGTHSAAGFDWIARRFSLWQVLDDEEPLLSAKRISYGVHVRGKASDNRELAAAIGRIDPEDLLDKGRELLRRENAYGLLVTPNARTEGVPIDVGSNAKDTSRSGTVAAVTESPLPGVWPAGHDLVSFSLDNGLMVRLLRVADTPYVTASLGFRGGSAWAPSLEVGKAMERGEVAAMPRDPIDHGVELIRTRLPDAQIESVRSLDSNLDKIIEVVAAAREPVVEWPSLGFRRAISAHIAADSFPERRARDRNFKALFGTHRYAEYAFAEDIRGVQKPAILRYIQSLRRPDNASLIVVGNVDAERLRGAVERYLGDWKSVGPERIRPPAAIEPVQNADASPEVLITHRPASVQTQIDWNCLLPVASDRDSAKINLVKSAVRSRLSEVLRERTQVAYSVSGSLNITAARYALVHWSTQVANEQLVAALMTLFQLETARNRSIWEGTLHWAKREIVFGTMPSLTTTATIADELMRRWIFGWEPSEAERYPAHISQTTVAEFMKLLQLCLSRLKISIVGDESTAATAVAQARESKLAQKHSTL